MSKFVDGRVVDGRAVDSRVPVRFGVAADAGPDSAMLIEGDGEGPPGRPAAHFTVPVVFGPHAIGCACCGPRAPVAQALSRLFLARARGEVPFFHEVVALVAGPGGEAAVRACLDNDPLAAAWFRLLRPD